MARMVYYSVNAGKSRLIQREQLIVLEVGRDEIDSASAFVDYINSEYGFSKSSVWYNLNRLKEKGMLDFANRDEIGKPLVLTSGGLVELSRLEPIKSSIIGELNKPARHAYDAVEKRVVMDAGNGMFL